MLLLIYLVVLIVWVLCIWKALIIAKARGANPFATLLFLVLTGTMGPLGLLIVYLFMPKRS